MYHFIESADVDSTSDQLPPTFIKRLSDIHAPAGELVKLTVEVDNSTQQPKIDWFYNGRQLKETKDVEIKVEGNKSSLVINELRDDNEGEYKVKVTNKYGSTSCSGCLKIFSKLHFMNVFEFIVKPYV